MLLGSIAAVYGYPPLGLEDYEGRQVWRGIMASKNTLGFWSAIAVMLYASLMTWPLAIERRILCVIGLLIAILVLAASVSATSVLSLLIGLLIMVYLFVAFRFRLGLLAMTVLGLLFTTLAALAFLQINTAELIGRSGDLTGRGEVWTQTWQLILEKPLTGYGYGTIWFPTADSIWIQQALTDLTWTTYHAHNGLLQLASEIGLPLTVLAVMMILQQLIEIIYCQYQRQQPGVLFVLGFTMALLASNYTEARLLVNRDLYWIFFLALPISMLQQVTVIKTDTEFSPVPANLPERTRNKMINIAAERLHRRRLKARLRSQRTLAGSQSVIDEQGIVIDPDTTDNN
jgi:O-antigen ligase